VQKNENIEVYCESKKLIDRLLSLTEKESVFLLMSSGNFNGINIDLHDSPDLLPTVATLAVLAKGKTTITGIKHARFKETDRVTNCVEELSKLGCEIKESEDRMEIINGINLEKADSNQISSHNDHRLAMAFILIGLKHEILIEGGDVFNVSFPNFIEAMAEIGVELELFGESCMK